MGYRLHSFRKHITEYGAEQFNHKNEFINNFLQMTCQGYIGDNEESCDYDGTIEIPTDEFKALVEGMVNGTITEETIREKYDEDFEVTSDLTWEELTDGLKALLETSNCHYDEIKTYLAGIRKCIENGHPAMLATALVSMEQLEGFIKQSEGNNSDYITLQWS